MPDGLGQLVKPDDDPENQAAYQAPGRCSQPIVQRVADATQKQERANQPVTGCGGRSCALNGVLKGPYRTSETANGVILPHAQSRLSRTPTLAPLQLKTDGV